MTDRLSSLAAGIVLVGISVALAIPDAPVSSSTDFAIIGPHEEVICAKSREVCLTALKAIQRGLWTPFSTHDPSLLKCVPKNDCFPPESLCIKGYNCQ